MGVASSGPRPGESVASALQRSRFPMQAVNRIAPAKPATTPASQSQPSDPFSIGENTTKKTSPVTVTENQRSLIHGGGGFDEEDEGGQDCGFDRREGSVTIPQPAHSVFDRGMMRYRLDAGHGLGSNSGGSGSTSSGSTTASGHLRPGSVGAKAGLSQAAAGVAVGPVSSLSQARAAGQTRVHVSVVSGKGNSNIQNMNPQRQTQTQGKLTMMNGVLVNTEALNRNADIASAASRGNNTHTKAKADDGKKRAAAAMDDEIASLLNRKSSHAAEAEVSLSLSIGFKDLFL